MRLGHKFAIPLLLAAACALAASAPLGAGARVQRRPVSLVLTNGKVFTSDARGSLAEAVAVEGNRVVAVGTSREIASAFEGARKIDLKGRLVTPGFTDAHIHFLSGGVSLLRLNLVGARTLAEAKARVATRVREVQPGAWITGRR